MFKPLSSILALGALLLSSLTVSVAHADRMNILILAEDWDETSVPRDNRIDRSVIARLTEVAQNQSRRLSDRFSKFDGFRIYDETAVTAESFSAGARRSDELLVKMARNISDASVDILVLYTIYAEDDVTYRDDGVTPAFVTLNLEIMLRAIDLDSGRTLARVSEFDETRPLPTDCIPNVATADEYAACVVRSVSRNLRDLAGDEFSALLTDTIIESYDLYGVSDDGTGGDIDDCGRAERFELEMRDFSPRELLRFEEEAANWDCVEELELLDTSNTIARYFLYTGRPENWVKRDLAGALAVMGLQGRIKFATDGSIAVKWDGTL